MKHNREKLQSIAKKVQLQNKLTLNEVSYLSSFSYLEKEPLVTSFIKQSAVPLSLFLGFLFAVYPEYFEKIVATSPGWMNLSPRMLSGINYIWNIIGEPVEQQNILFHIPNIVLYSFGILGIKRLFDVLTKKTWLDGVLRAQETLIEKIKDGTLPLSLTHGHSVLFVGNGDFIGMQFVLDHENDQAVTISTIKPSYTDIWNKYDTSTSYEDLKTVIERVTSDKTGEYIFFPVKDDQIFLPSPTAYDLSPYKIDILCQDIRNIEKELKRKTKRIIIIGDKYHHSFVQSVDKRTKIKDSADIISLERISKRYSNVTLIDPTDIVIKKIITIAHGRKIVFRATTAGIREYKDRFYARIEEQGYKPRKNTKGVLTIGYDLFEDQTEQQTRARAVNGYLPVVLSKNVYDALVRNGYKKSEFLYVPELVLQHLKAKASEQ